MIIIIIIFFFTHSVGLQTYLSVRCHSFVMVNIVRPNARYYCYYYYFYYYYHRRRRLLRVTSLFSSSMFSCSFVVNILLCIHKHFL